MKTRLLVACLAILPVFLLAQEPKQTKAVDLDLKGYKTTKTAIKADPKTFKDTPVKAVLPGLIGVELASSGKPVIESLLPDAPAATVGLKAGDQITQIDGVKVDSAETARDRLRGAAEGELITVRVIRGASTIDYAITPKALSKPMSATVATPGRVVMGVQIGETKKSGGVEITEVTTGGPAAKAGMKAGDVITLIGDRKLTETDTLRDLMSTRRAGETIALTVQRGKEELVLRVTLAEETAATTGRPGTSWDDRLPNIWKKTTYKLAVIGIEYPDVKHNAKIKDEDWEKSLFSYDKYTGQSATGQRTYGSMADYYKEISYNTLKIEGKFVGWVEVSKKRTEYSTGSGTSTKEKTGLLVEAMDKLVAKDKDALKDFDGVFFLYAGDRVNTTRGGLYWPHRASVTHDKKRWPYFIVQEGGDRMTNISVFCHEFGHMLGLPDLYARPEQPLMEGVGVWCAMANQLPNGRPQHFSAWSKEQLGWIKPVTIDPRVKQKLILSPIEDNNGECFKIPLKANGSEYILLENRKKKGWDSELPAEGLLIWRVIPGNTLQRVFIEEAHGIEGKGGPQAFLGAVPFPAPSNDSFTPYTTPSSKAQTGGGYDLHITNIRRLPDGRVAFQIGYEYQ